jgi:hypothetical protein
MRACSLPFELARFVSVAIGDPINQGAHVLVVSRDQMLLQTRALMLGAYFQVDSAGRISEAELALSKIDFDLVVLCYSIPDDEYQKLLELTSRQKHRPKILILNNEASGHTRHGGDGEYTADTGPYQLVRKVAKMVGFPMKPMGRSAKGDAAMGDGADVPATD